MGETDEARSMRQSFPARCWWPWRCLSFFIPLSGGQVTYLAFVAPADTLTTFVAMERIMGMPVRIDDLLYEQAKADASAEHRSIAGQIEFWAKVGRAALDNPDLPASFIAETLIAMAEPREQATPFVPRGRHA